MFDATGISVNETNRPYGIMDRRRADRACSTGDAYWITDMAAVASHHVSLVPTVRSRPMGPGTYPYQGIGSATRSERL